ncbi:MAG: hypothetical protein ACOCUQ_00810 [Bacteroidota bacterium]
MGRQIGYQNVTFPARCQITYETPDWFENVVYRFRTEVTINEPGDWLITLHKINVQKEKTLHMCKTNGAFCKYHWVMGYKNLMQELRNKENNSHAALLKR